MCQIDTICSWHPALNSTSVTQMQTAKISSHRPERFVFPGVVILELQVREAKKHSRFRWISRTFFRWWFGSSAQFGKSRHPQKVMKSPIPKSGRTGGGICGLGEVTLGAEQDHLGTILMPASRGGQAEEPACWRCAAGKGSLPRILTEKVCEISVFWWDHIFSWLCCFSDHVGIFFLWF